MFVVTLFCPADVYSEEIDDVKNHNNQTMIQDNFIIKYSAVGGITGYNDNIIYNYTENHLLRLEYGPERYVSETISDIQLNDTQKQTLRKMIEESNIFNLSFQNKEELRIADGFNYKLEIISGESRNTIIWNDDNYENYSQIERIPVEVTNLIDLLDTYQENSTRIYTEVDIAAIESQNVQDILNNGDLFLAEKNYTEAILWYDKVLAIRPHDTRVLVNIAHALTSLGQHEEALILVEKELASYPDFSDPWALLEKGRILFNMGQYDEALIWANKALDANPTNNASALILKKEIESKIK